MSSTPTIRKVEPDELWKEAGQFLRDRMSPSFAEELTNHMVSRGFTLDERHYFCSLITEQLNLELCALRLKLGVSLMKEKE